MAQDSGERPHTAVIADQVCPDDIRRMLRWLHAAGETFEIRTLNSQKDKWIKISCGYFRDAEVATEAVVDHVGDYDPAQVYVTLNQLGVGGVRPGTASSIFLEPYSMSRASRE